MSLQHFYLNQEYDYTIHIRIRHHIFSADVYKETRMDCYQHCVERYGISLSDMANQQNTVV